MISIYMFWILKIKYIIFNNTFFNSFTIFQILYWKLYTSFFSFFFNCCSSTVVCISPQPLSQPTHTPTSHPQSYLPLALSMGPLYMFLHDPSHSKILNESEKNNWSAYLRKTHHMEQSELENYILIYV